MNIVTLECRDCGTSPSFAIDYEGSVADTQDHMDINFKARCGDCYACDWKVTELKKVVGALDVSNRTATRKSAVQ